MKLGRELSVREQIDLLNAGLKRVEGIMSAYLVVEGDLITRGIKNEQDGPAFVRAQTERIFAELSMIQDSIDQARSRCPHSYLLAGDMSKAAPRCVHCDVVKRTI